MWSKERRHLRSTRALEPESFGLSVDRYVCLFLPRGPYYLAKVPGLFLNAASCAQVDKAVLAQYIFSPLSLVRQKYSIICQEAGEVGGLRVLGLSFIPQASALLAQSLIKIQEVRLTLHSGPGPHTLCQSGWG